MTSVAVTVPPYLAHKFHGYECKFASETDVLDKWVKLIHKTKWENIINLSISEAIKYIDDLMKFIRNNREAFSIDFRPISDDMFENHFKPHYTKINEFVLENVISPRDAVKLAEIIYLYDSVLPHLSEMVVKPNTGGDEIRIILIPDALYNWMFKLDFLWEKLLIKRVLDRDMLNNLEEHKMRFLKKALELKVFLPIPPKDISHKIKLDKMWLRRTSVDWDKVVGYMFDKIINNFKYILSNES